MDLNPWILRNVPNSDDASSDETRLFQELPAGCFLQSLAFIGNTSNNLEAYSFRAMPALTDHHFPTIADNRDNVDPIEHLQHEEIV